MPQGFVLIELVVTMVIIGILTLMITVGLPQWREGKAAVLTEQQLSSLLREASQMALQEARAQACLDEVTNRGGTPEDSRRCSDIGVSIQGTTFIMFADINGSDHKYDARDYKLFEQPAPAQVTFNGGNHDFLFLAAPPTITLFTDGQPTPGQVVIQTGDNSATFNIDTYGIITRR